VLKILQFRQNIDAAKMTSTKQACQVTEVPLKLQIIYGTAKEELQIPVPIKTVLVTVSKTLLFFEMPIIPLHNIYGIFIY
jgi:hypothetical protein